MSETPDLCVVGHPFAPIGMGTHGRAAIRALRAARLSPGVVDIYGMDRRRDAGLEAEFAPLLAPGLSPRTNLFCINADEVEPTLARMDAGAFASAYNIIYPAWELARYPEPWARILERFDEVWAPSAFVADAITPAVARPVLHMPLSVEPRLGSFLGRRYFAIPEHSFAMLFSFDFSSYAQRKNPGAVLEVFERLVARRPEAALHCVIKFKGGDPEHPTAKALMARIAALGGRAQALTRELSDDEMGNLVRNVDAFVSLQRSEGFGFGMAEAMALGRVAAATGYSGNLDFMTPETSRLVDYRLVPVGPDDYPYPDDQVWAEPDLDQAVAILEALLDDPVELRALGGRARRHMRTHFSHRASGLRYAARLGELAAKA
ncbi:glycosyltransferase family 4 protein [Phenylobacterium aquaticum]|uniref:glycosyltransferase family 4 protein n=1 Tax=Phenylobacterium aquaticum TaxID=1763816 RepID=UPI0026EF18EA|nr:glycosyltransferase family 4 protein [Phenylobacterium aquaticum]